MLSLYVSECGQLLRIYAHHYQIQYHLYAPLGPHRENLLAYQRTAHEFFIPDDLREDLQRKAHASLQLLPSKRSEVPWS